MKKLQKRAPITFKFLIIALLFSLVLIMPIQHGATAKATGLPEIIISYYYNNPCGSCREDSTFHEYFLTQIGDAKEGVTLKFRFYNIFHTEDNTRFVDTCRGYNISLAEQSTPLLIIGETLLIGKKEIDSNLVSAFLAEKAKIMKELNAKDDTISRIAYFYVSPCDECSEVGMFLDSIPSSYHIDYNGKYFESSFVINAFNVANGENVKLINQYFQSYDVPKSQQNVPIVFYKGGFLSGQEKIEKGLEEAIKSGQCIGAITSSGNTEINLYEWSGIFITGLVNGFNPCSISMLLFLIAMLLSRKANILKIGTLFIFGKFIAYLALGTLLFRLLSTINNTVFALFTSIGKYILLVISAIVGAVNISDFIASKNEKYNKIRLQLPKGLRKLNHKCMRSINKIQNNGFILSLTAFFLGIGISVGEFLCTGQIYLATILYLMKRNSTLEFQTVLAFFIYIIGMLVPLVVITFVVHKGKEIFDVSEIARSKMPYIKLLNATLFFAFAIIIIILF